MPEEIFGVLGHPKYADYAEDITKSSHILVDITNDILNRSKAEAGKIKLSEAIFSASNAIQEFVEVMLGFSADGVGARMEFHDRVSALQLLADERIFR